MDSDKHDQAISTKSDGKICVEDEKLLTSWNLYKARENFRLQLQMTALKNSLDKQMRNARVLNMIEVPPENLDDDEIFNDRLEFREGELAGNYGLATKDEVQSFYGESKPIFKCASLSVPRGKKNSQVVQELPELYVLAADNNQVGTENISQVILIEESLEKTKDQALVQFESDAVMVIPADPQNEALPDLLTMETQVELAEFGLNDLTFITTDLQ